MRDRTSLEDHAAGYDHHWDWRKSSYSMSNGACVEIRNLARGSISEVCVRDSKAPQGPELRFGSEAWTAFLVTFKS